jgi:hypothetical protein
MTEPSTELTTDWAGAVGLFVFGLLAPLVILLTASNRLWEMSALTTVVGLTIVLSTMSCGARATWVFFDRTSWIVRHPVRTSGLDVFLAQARSVIGSAYAVGWLASFVAAIVSEALRAPEKLAPIALKPLIHAVFGVVDETVQEEAAANVGKPDRARSARERSWRANIASRSLRLAQARPVLAATRCSRTRRTHAHERRHQP